MASLSAASDIDMTYEHLAEQIRKLESVMNLLYSQMMTTDQCILELTENMKGSAVADMQTAYEDNRDKISKCLKNLAVIDENLISYVNSMSDFVDDAAAKTKSTPQ